MLQDACRGKVQSTKLKVDEEDIKTTTAIKYLGDWVTPTMNNSKTIDDRVNKGIGTTSQIVSMLRHVSKGFFYIEIGLIFRDSMLLSKLLFNAEVWLNLKKSDLNKLIKLDESYLFRILGLKRSVSKECL